MKRSAVLLGLALVSLCLLGVSSAANTPLAGSLDPSFGSGGAVTKSSGIEAIALQPDGKIVVAGGAAAGAGFALARYLPDGLPDVSFGDAGNLETDFPSWASADAIALQPDGKIVVAGTSVIPDTRNVSEFALARYNPDGSLDTSFGTAGITKTFIPVPGSPATANARAVAILPDGNILAAGSGGWNNGADNESLFALVRYTPGGAVDPTFGDGGVVQSSFYGQDLLSGIVVLPDGRIVATGTGGVGGHGQDIETMALVGYTPDGSLDPTFGGEVKTAEKLHYSGGPSTLQHGKIVVAGYTRNHPVIARYTASGRVDSSFGQHGFAELRHVTGISAAVLAQSDGKIVIAEPSLYYDSTSGSTEIIRLLPNGRLDPGFGRGGIASLGAGSSHALALQADGKVLVGGARGNAGTLTRLLAGNNCVVPVLRGKTVSKASAELKAAYCRSGRISKLFSNRVARGRVISTAPSRGSRLPGGAKVELVVSRGKH